MNKHNDVIERKFMKISPRNEELVAPLHSTDEYYTRNSSCITLLCLHHNHKMSISCHKNGLVSMVTNPLADGLFFMCFAVRIFWRNYLAINSLLVSVSLCQDGIRDWKRFAFMWIVFTFVELFLFTWDRHNCVRKMAFRFTCAVLWKLHGNCHVLDITVHVCDCICSGV